MDVIVEKGCGIDVGQAFVFACALLGSPGTRPSKEICKFSTTKHGLLQLKAWLRERGVTHVAMESTGVYWVPLYNILEGHFDLTVGNAQHIKNVPGRKTDIKDCEWLAQLLRHGLIKKSFVPSPEVRELRTVVRQRRKWVQERASFRNQILKFLETCNIKLSSVASDAFGKSGMLMLNAIAEGKLKPEEIAQLAKGKLRKKRDELILALDGLVTDNHRVVLDLLLQRLKRFDEDIAQLEALIEAHMVSYSELINLLILIPGIDRTLAHVIIAETGGRLSAFPTAAAFAAWCGVCPGNHESAGRHKKGPRRRGNLVMTTALVEAAVSASKKKDSYLKDKFWRLNGRRGRGRATMALAHKLAIIVYQVLQHRVPYKDLGAGYLDEREKTHVTHGLVRRLERLGYNVKLEKPAA